MSKTKEQLESALRDCFEHVDGCGRSDFVSSYTKAVMDKLDAYIEQCVVELLTPPLDACTFCNFPQVDKEHDGKRFCAQCWQDAIDQSKPYKAVYTPMIYRKHGGE